MLIKLLAFMGLLFVIFGCGQKNDENNYSINSLYISISQRFNMPDNSVTLRLFNEGVSELDTLSQEEIMFHSPIRLTIIKFGELDENLLGLTECSYSSKGDSSCIITISSSINPDNNPWEETTFRGVFKHEIGHAFGLGHIKASSSNVMFPLFYEEQTLKNNLDRFIVDLTNFRKNGPASGLPTIFTK